MRNIICMCVCWVIQKCQKMLLYPNPHLSNPALVKRQSTKIKVGLLLWVLLLIDSTITPSIVFLTTFDQVSFSWPPLRNTCLFLNRWCDLPGSFIANDDKGMKGFSWPQGRFSFYFQERPFEPDEVDYTQVWEIITEWTCSTSQT